MPRESVEEEEEAEEEEAELGDAQEELPVIQDTRIPIQDVCANERDGSTNCSHEALQEHK